MAFDENIADRIRTALQHVPSVKEKKMFGGLAFMVNDKMCITTKDDRIMLRIDPIINDELIQTKKCEQVIMRGRILKGYIHINSENFKNKKGLIYWIQLALNYNKISASSKK
ncbi:MAG: TfoX/Sxy family protein [Ginsengibacter sp.]